MKTTRPLNVLIVDDEFLVAATLKRTLTELGHRVAGVYTHIPEAAARIKRGGIDLVITDIFFHGAAAGIEWATVLRGQGVPYLLFSGGAPSEILKLASRTDALGMLHKPVRKREVYIRLEALTLTGRLTEREAAPVLSIRHRGRNLLLETKAIMYVESDKNSCIIHTPDSKYVETGNLWRMKEKLPADTFFQVHRSFIININLVRDYTARELRMDDGTRIPIGRKYRPELIGMLRSFAK